VTVPRTIVDDAACSCQHPFGLIDPSSLIYTSCSLTSKRLMSFPRSLISNSKRHVRINVASNLPRGSGFEGHRRFPPGRSILKCYNMPANNEEGFSHTQECGLLYHSTYQQKSHSSLSSQTMNAQKASDVVVLTKIRRLPFCSRQQQVPRVSQDMAMNKRPLVSA